MPTVEASARPTRAVGAGAYPRRALLRWACLALAPLVAGRAPARAQVTDLIATLGQRLGLTREQAAGGAGAVFRLARQRLGPAEFSILAESVPGSDRLIEAAPVIADTGGGIDDLAPPFALLGIPVELIPAFVEAVLAFVAVSGSDPAAGLLRRTLVGP